MIAFPAGEGPLGDVDPRVRGVGPRVASTRRAPGRNRVLCALPAEALAPLWPHLEAVTLAGRDVLCAPTAPVAYVYFPETVVVSLMRDLPGDSRASDVAARRSGRPRPVDVGTVGCEGMVGLDVFLRGGATGGVGIPEKPGDTADTHALAQVPGSAQRMRAAAFTQLADAPGALHQVLLRCTQAFLTQVTHTAACNAGHRVEARCAGWLCTMGDRVGRNVFPLTHEALAGMLGVRRAGVAVAVNALQDAGLLHARCGTITILDRSGLEAAACPCSRAVHAEYARLLPPHV